MKVIEARGSHRVIGAAIGEQLRDEIREHIDGFLLQTEAECAASAARLRVALATFLPAVLEQFEGMASGAGVALSSILALNRCEGSPRPMFDTDNCSNVAFADGPDGPLWGKNNDGGSPPTAMPAGDRQGQRPRAVIKVHPDDGIPALCVTFCGWLSGGDMMNAEGLAVGHSSVGSRLQQSASHAPVLQWMYWQMLRCRDAAEYLRALASTPLYGKGFTQLAVDRGGRICSPEIPCPLVQCRRPPAGATAMHCVNHYQLPELAHLDRRSPEGKAYSLARQSLLERECAAGDRSLAHMRRILSLHGAPAICRHGGADLSWTEYSLIGLCSQGRLLVADGPPCTVPYAEIDVE